MYRQGEREAESSKMKHFKRTSEERKEGRKVSGRLPPSLLPSPSFSLPVFYEERREKMEPSNENSDILQAVLI